MQGREPWSRVHTKRASISGRNDAVSVECAKALCWQLHIQNSTLSDHAEPAKGPALADSNLAPGAWERIPPVFEERF